MRALDPDRFDAPVDRRRASAYQLWKNVSVPSTWLAGRFHRMRKISNKPTRYRLVLRCQLAAAQLCKLSFFALVGVGDCALQ
jgi:hypothetical protein